MAVGMLPGRPRPARVGQGTAVQDQGNPFGITACSTGSGSTSDSSEPSSDADLSPGQHGHGGLGQDGHLGHRLTCGAAPGRGTRGRSPFPDDAAPGITSGPFRIGAGPAREGCQALTRAREPIGLVSRRSGGRRLRRRDLAKAPPRRPSSPLAALLEGVPGTSGGGGEEEGHEGDSPDEEGNEDDQQQG